MGPAQLPAVVPGQKRSYFVAVSSDRMIPQVLDQTFATNPTDTNVRLEPVESVARMVDDPLEPFIKGSTTSSGGAEFPDNTFISPDTTNNPTDTLYQPASTFIGVQNVQSLQANVKPFSLGDVQMFVSSANGDSNLWSVDPTIALA